MSTGFKKRLEQNFEAGVGDVVHFFFLLKMLPFGCPSQSVTRKPSFSLPFLYT